MKRKTPINKRPTSSTCLAERLRIHVSQLMVKFTLRKQRLQVFHAMFAAINGSVPYFLDAAANLLGDLDRILSEVHARS